MSLYFIAERPITNQREDRLHIELESCGERVNVLLTRHAAIALWGSLSREVPRLLAAKRADIIPFPGKKARKRLAKLRGANHA
jgi:hypothetical protein